MDDLLAGFIKGLMKTILILFILLFLVPNVAAESDYLLQIMQNSWSDYDQKEDKYNDVSECYCPNQNSDFEPENSENEANGEHYSWDNLYIEKYETLEIVIDPYK